MSNEISNISWGNIGIRLDLIDPEKTLEDIEATIERPIVLTPPARKLRPLVMIKPDIDTNSKVHTVWLLVVEVLIVIIIVTAMCANAEAGMAFLKFEVFSVTEKTIIVTDEHEDFFTFDREGDNNVKKGDDLVVCTDLVWQGDGTWKWDTDRTAIIQNNGGDDD